MKGRHTMKSALLTTMDFASVLTALQTQRPEFVLYQAPNYVSAIEKTYKLILSDPNAILFLHSLLEYDESTFLHSVDVGFLSQMMCSLFTIEKPDLFRKGAYLHDVGKLRIAASILKKEGPLTPQELWMMQYHTLYGYNLLEATQGQYIAHLALYHHEHPSGFGYPAGLKGNEMKLDYLLLRIIDVFSALTLNRCYRKGITISKALSIILDSFKESLSTSDYKELYDVLTIVFGGNFETLPLVDSLVEEHNENKLSFSIA
ncbi:hypothetical protein CN918_27195 [Priestia megaterium]|nr:hypothetical protein CN918_27195 [Priestia megaterium]